MDYHYWRQCRPALLLERVIPGIHRQSPAIVLSKIWRNEVPSPKADSHTGSCRKGQVDPWWRELQAVHGHLQHRNWKCDPTSLRDNKSDWGVKRTYALACYEIPRRRTPCTKPFWIIILLWIRILGFLQKFLWKQSCTLPRWADHRTINNSEEADRRF